MVLPLTMQVLTVMTSLTVRGEMTLFSAAGLTTVSLVPMGKTSCLATTSSVLIYTMPTLTRTIFFPIVLSFRFQTQPNSLSAVAIKVTISFPEEMEMISSLAMLETTPLAVMRGMISLSVALTAILQHFRVL